MNTTATAAHAQVVDCKTLIAHTMEEIKLLVERTLSPEVRKALSSRGHALREVAAIGNATGTTIGSRLRTRAPLTVDDPAFREAVLTTVGGLPTTDVTTTNAPPAD